MVTSATDPSSVELLAPAGESRALRAALAAGADAVYFGLERWSARAFAGNFAGEEALVAVEMAHRYGARAYLALNTLLKDEEIEPALTALEAPYLAGLDALIVADLGLLARVREAYPDLPLHASTQLNTHSSTQLAALARLGCRRAILARELSLDEIAALDSHGLELEAFVHGALCYGYSGDCLLSSMIGGRSGNRGRCSQSCRLRYELRCGGAGSAGQSPARPAPQAAPVSGSESARGARRPQAADDEASSAGTRVMSTSDLAAIALLPQLLAAGVTSFKLEGRMKDAAYVGVTTAVYRQALDAALADPDGYEVRPEWLASLEQSFSRSFTTAHLEGRHHEVRSGGRGGHRGVLVGRVATVDAARGEVRVRLTQPVSAGDVVYFYTPSGQTEPLRLAEGGESTLALRVRERVSVKDRLFRLAAAGVGALAQDLITGRTALRPLALHMRLEGVLGEPARLIVTSTGGMGDSVAVTSAAPLAAARHAGLGEVRVRDALGSLGGTPYCLDALDLAVGEGLFMSVAELKELRRRAVAGLDERRVAARRRSTPRKPVPRPTRPTSQASVPRPAAAPGVVLRVRPGEPALAAPGVTALCLDVLCGDTRAEIAAAAGELSAAGLPLRLRLPEVLFDREEAWWRALLALPWQGVYARHLGLLASLGVVRSGAGARLAVVLEYPLQGLNGVVADVAAELAGYPPAAVVAAPELSLTEIEVLAKHGAALEILAFGRQQVLHTRDQLGRAEGLVAQPARGGHVGLLLTDAKGYEFPAVLDEGGTRLFNARVTNLAANLDELRAAGVSGFHVVQSDLDPEERRAFAAGGLEAVASLTSRERSTTGHLFRGVA